MPSFTLKTNTAEFLAKNTASRNLFLEDVQTRLNRAELFFIGDIQKNQMTGHFGPGGTLGTRVVTGMLRRNWFQKTIIINKKIKALVWTTTPYAPLHEEGGLVRKTSAFGKPTRPYWVHYTKRLHIGEAWDTQFQVTMKKEIDASAVKYLR